MTRPPSFASDVKPLFRDGDRRSMLFLFDLWDHASVSANAEAILAAVEDGSMPCDSAWSEAQVSLLRDWMTGGRQP